MSTINGLSVFRATYQAPENDYDQYLYDSAAVRAETARLLELARREVITDHVNRESCRRGARTRQLQAEEAAANTTWRVNQRVHLVAPTFKANRTSRVNARVVGVHPLRISVHRGPQGWSIGEVIVEPRMLRRRS